MRQKVILAALLGVLMAAAACTGGLSYGFRRSAKEALAQLRQAADAESRPSLEAADAAVSAARAKVKTKQDLRTADVLDWYATLLHRSDRHRTRNWCAICDGEAQMYLDGKTTGYARIWTDTGLNPVAVKRGDCQTAFFQMLAEDCAREVGSSATDACNLPLVSSSSRR